MPLLAEDGLSFSPIDEPKRTRGRPKGSTKAAKEREARPGSRFWAISNMKPGDVLLFENQSGKKVSRLMQQINCDILRSQNKGKLRLMTLLGVHPLTRTIYEIVRIDFK